jgi:lysophospholipase L1-like esterase
MFSRRWLLFAALVLVPAGAFAVEPSPGTMLREARRVLFLGDSITAGGGYIAHVDAWLQVELGDKAPQLINGGLASETVSGLSEEGHAGGKFPRPDLAERIDRLLPLVKPDLVIACYGINCGIYQPFDSDRFAKYQAGHHALREKATQAGAKMIVVTPPFYDDQRKPLREFSYNEVLDKYSTWLNQQRRNGWTVIDLHTAMTLEVNKRRETEPMFTLQPDGVHPNDAGHWFIAQQLLRAFGDETAAAADSPQAMLAAKRAPAAILPLVQQRMSVLRDAYVGAAGHKRPGVAKGLPVVEAEAKAADLTAKIRATLAEGE